MNRISFLRNTKPSGNINYLYFFMLRFIMFRACNKVNAALLEIYLVRLHSNPGIPYRTLSIKERKRTVKNAKNIFHSSFFSASSCSKASTNSFREGWPVLLLICQFPRLDATASLSRSSRSFPVRTAPLASFGNTGSSGSVLLWEI